MLRRLVEMGNTVMVIITAQGTVRQLSRAKSPTAPFIRAELER